MTSILSLGEYLQLVRISRNDEGKIVDWVGFFGFLDGSVTEGWAFEVASVNGNEVLQPVRNGYCVRLYTDRIAYSTLGYVRWKRRGDSVERIGHMSEVFQFPCIRVDRVTTKHLFNDPEFQTIQRTIVTLRVVPANVRAVDGGESAISLEYQDE